MTPGIEQNPTYAISWFRADNPTRAAIGELLDALAISPWKEQLSAYLGTSADIGISEGK